MKIYACKNVKTLATYIFSCNQKNIKNQAPLGFYMKITNFDMLRPLALFFA